VSTQPYVLPGESLLAHRKRFACLNTAVCASLNSGLMSTSSTVSFCWTLWSGNKLKSSSLTVAPVSSSLLSVTHVFLLLAKERFHLTVCLGPYCFWPLRLKFWIRFLANVNSRSRSLYRYMPSTVRLSVCLSSVCNVRAPYSGGSNFRQFFYRIRYLGHPLTSTENFTEIVQNEQLAQVNTFPYLGSLIT